MEEKDTKALERIDKTIEDIKNNNFRFLFFISDPKNNPSGSVGYVYETAYQLQEAGFHVMMIHQVKDFEGVGEWIGEKYANLPYLKMKEKDEDTDGEDLNISIKDFLIIPELFSDVMNQTKQLPCKRIVLSQKFEYIPQFMSDFTKTWSDYGIHDVVTTSDIQAKMLKEIFPFIKTKVVSPSISSYFKDDNQPKELTISLLCKDQTLINKIVKPFYWKYPIYKWITFRDLRGLPKELFAEELRRSAISIWVDNETSFGYMPLEAIKSGNVVIGKLPDTIPDWAFEDKERTNLSNKVIWVDSLNEIHKVIASTVKAWMMDQIPEAITQEMEKSKELFGEEKQITEIRKVYNEFVDERIKELEEVKKIVIKK